MPVSRFAKRSGLFALLTIPVNIASNLLGRLFDQPLESASDVAYAVAWIAYLVVFLAARVLVVALVAYSFYNARRAFQEIRTGKFAGRGRTIASIVWGVIQLALVLYSVVSWVVQLTIAAYSGQ